MKTTNIIANLIVILISINTVNGQDQIWKTVVPTGTTNKILDYDEDGKTTTDDKRIWDHLGEGQIVYLIDPNNTEDIAIREEGCYTLLGKNHHDININIYCNNVTIDGLYSSMHRGEITVTNSRNKRIEHIVIERINFRFTSPKDNGDVISINGDDLSVKNCSFIGTESGFAINLTGERNLVSNNHIYSSNLGGIMISGNRGKVIANCVELGDAYHGISLFGQRHLAMDNISHVKGGFDMLSNHSSNIFIDNYYEDVPDDFRGLVIDPDSLN